MKIVEVLLKSPAKFISEVKQLIERTSILLVEKDRLSRMANIAKFLLNINHKYTFIVKIRPMAITEIDNNISWDASGNQVILMDNDIKYDFKIDEVWVDVCEYKYMVKLRCMYLKRGISSTIICVGPSGTGKSLTIEGDQRHDQG